MADINFDCTKCGQNLDAPEDMAGLFVECPSCAAIIKVPTRVPSPDTGKPAMTFQPAPPPPPREEPGDEDKGSTMRINLPPDLGVPEPRHRKIIIKRPSR